MDLKKIGLGGGCHWCTEGVFSTLKGIASIDQGWIASLPPNDAFSEAILIEYDCNTIKLEDLILIHLHTHASTSNHSLRAKYRSAIYTFNQEDQSYCLRQIDKLNNNFAEPIVTKVLPFQDFSRSPERYQNYFQKNPEKPFCKTHIEPKINLLMKKYRHIMQ